MSDMTSSGAKWTFVIDTDKYAGNFEREMCAYLTGQVGDCGVGSEFSEVARKEIPAKLQEEFDDKVAHVPDDHGCSRPVTIWSNPKWFNDGMGSHWKKTDKDQKKQLSRYAKSIEEYEIPHMKQVQKILEELKAGKTVMNWTIAAAEREIKRYQKKIDEAKKKKKISRYPAYMSVGIWFHKKPSDALIDFLKKRVLKYVEYRKEHLKSWEKSFTLNIEGFRLIHHIKKEQIFEV